MAQMALYVGQCSVALAQALYVHVSHVHTHTHKHAHMHTCLHTPHTLYLNLLRLSTMYTFPCSVLDAVLSDENTASPPCVVMVSHVHRTCCHTWASTSRENSVDPLAKSSHWTFLTAPETARVYSINNTSKWHLWELQTNQPRSRTFFQINYTPQSKLASYSTE